MPPSYDDLEEMQSELEQLQEAFRKRLEEAIKKPSEGVPDEVKAGLKRMWELEHKLEQAISSGSASSSSGESSESRSSR